MKEGKTGRGFHLLEFQDRNGVECSLQKSSIATEDCIWLGASDIGLQEFVANRPDGPAWRDIELENTIKHHYVANNRMHLTREQVKELLPHLERFVETGELYG